MRLFDLRDPLHALSLLTRIPAPVDHALAFRRAALAAWAWPLVGALIGALAGGALWLGLALGLPPLAAAAGALAVSLTLTGAFHEDGLADCADGFGGGMTPARRMEIMLDSRVGAFGAAALVLALLAKAAFMAEMSGPLAVAALAAAGALSRAAVPLILLLGPQARAGGMAASAGPPGWPTVLAALATGLALGWLALGWLGVWWIAVAMLSAALLAALATRAVARAKIGGVTGDVLGAAQITGELAALATLAGLLARGA